VDFDKRLQKRCQLLIHRGARRDRGARVYSWG
jgi:hypothetical protein